MLKERGVDADVLTGRGAVLQLGRARPHLTAVPNKPPLPPRMTEQEDQVLQWHDRFVARAVDPDSREYDAMEFLAGERGLSPETIERFKLGYRSGDNGRITFPVRVRGKLYNVRRYKPHATKAKMISFENKQQGVPMLYPWEVLRDEAATLPVLFCEGELDALLTNQESDGQFVAVTGTGGAGTPPRDLSALCNRQVFVAYDCDTAGVSGAEKLQHRLSEAGAKAYVLDLTGLGLSPDSGEDMTDYFLRHRLTAGALRDEMDRMRGIPDEDDVLTAVQGLFLANDDLALDYLDDGLTDHEVLALNPPEFVVDGWVPKGFYSVLYGEPGAKKTFVLLDMAKSIRRGATWQGQAVQQGAVLFFQGEGLQQLTPRIQAWEDYHDAMVDDAPGAWFGRNIDLTRPSGAAGVVRTVQRFERQERCRVVAVVVDPLVEFMTGEENGEGMELATRGLRAIAQHLDIAVIVGHHTNAAGARARGGDWLRMRAGAHIRAESLATGQTGLVQQKQKNAEKLAVVLNPVLVGDSLVLERSTSLTAAQYAAEKDATEGTERAQTKIKLSVASSAAKDELGRDLILEYVAGNPGANQGRIVGGCRGKGVGSDPLKRILEQLAVGGGPLRVESHGTAPNSPRNYWLREGEKSHE